MHACRVSHRSTGENGTRGDLTYACTFRCRPVKIWSRARAFPRGTSGLICTRSARSTLVCACVLRARARLACVKSDQIVLHPIFVIDLSPNRARAQRAPHTHTSLADNFNIFYTLVPPPPAAHKVPHILAMEIGEQREVAHTHADMEAKNVVAAKRSAPTCISENLHHYLHWCTVLLYYSQQKKPTPQFCSAAASHIAASRYRTYFRIWKVFGRVHARSVRARAWAAFNFI